MKSRLATIATLLTLVGGTGGAIAVAAHSPSAGPNGGGAAKGQYCDGKQKQPGQHGASHTGDDCGLGDDKNGGDKNQGHGHH